ncbi:MAG: c-type cytochrome [Planctomycetes bacterium]|nr:c-type cytochrome [Planctomycetota bacterium]
MSGVSRDDILDHEYDGIREFDNPLPGWWVAVLWCTCLFAALYFFYYEIGSGRSIYDAYDAAALAHFDAQAKRWAHLEISDATIATFAANEDLMRGVRGMFQLRCASCHRADAGGNIGPNLTDRHWLHGNAPTEIYKTISEGVPAKGMQSWKKSLGPVQIMYLSAYIQTLQGSNPPNPKAPEGVLREPAPAAAPAPAAETAAPTGAPAEDEKK